MNTVADMTTASVLSGQSEMTGFQQASPGFLVFSRSLQLQYANRRALELIRNMNDTMTEAGSIMLSIPLLELRDQVRGSLDSRLKDHLWEPFEVSRVVSRGGQQFLIRGFGYPNREAMLYSRIVIVLEEFRSVEKDMSYQLHA
jgi:hypothetical protein